MDIKLLKRIVAFLLCVTLTAGSLPVNVWAEEAVPEEPTTEEIVTEEISSEEPVTEDVTEEPATEETEAAEELPQPIFAAWFLCCSAHN